MFGHPEMQPGHGLPGRRACGAPGRARGPLLSAFSLVEVLIVVALLSVIVLGLMSMFGQTQRAFRAGLQQTDVLEAGRVTTDFLVREIAQAQPSGLPNTVNFYAETALARDDQPLYQALPGTGERRTNFLQDLFFLTSSNQIWTAIGYRLSTPDAGAGTLYRYSYTVPNPLNSAAWVPVMFNDFSETPVTNTNRFNRVADGIVHLRVRAFNPNGQWITGNLPNNKDASGNDYLKSDIRWPNTVGALIPYEIGLYKFLSNAVPAAVEIELGFLETRTLERVNALPTPALRRNYLSNHVGQVHMFRQRIPISTVDVKAYQ